MSISLLIWLLLFISSPQSPTAVPSLQLVWSDEFSYAGSPDPNKWNYDSGGWGFGNNELQYYCANRLQNARVENGRLIIEAHKEAFATRQYTSAKLWTKGRFSWQYGRIEVRAKLPKGRGTWPAIWMLNAKEPMTWPDDGEIDIMEHVGYQEGIIHGTVHTSAYNHTIGTQKSGYITMLDATQVFHTYAIDWNAQRIDFYVDNTKFYSFDKATWGSAYSQWPFDQSFYLILNMAIGGDWGGAQGIDNSIFPQRMEVDWVRVYQYSDCSSLVTVKNGNWNDPTVWSCNRLPTADDVVQIKHAISIPANFIATAKRVQYDTGKKLTIAATARLQASH